MTEKTQLLLQYDISKRIAYDLQRFDNLRKDEEYQDLSVQSLDRIVVMLAKHRENLLTGKYSCQ
jgi:hypothetical protein